VDSCSQIQTKDCLADSVQRREGQSEVSLLI